MLFLCGIMMIYKTLIEGGEISVEIYDAGDCITFEIIKNNTDEYVIELDIPEAMDIIKSLKLAIKDCKEYQKEIKSM